MTDKTVIGKFIPVDVNEYFRMLAEIRSQETQEDLSLADGSAIDPVICKGIADIDIQKDDREM